MCIKLLSDYITGLPDRLCLFPGQRLVFIELKTTGQKPRRIQLYIHKKLRDLGFRVEVVDNSKQLTEIIESVACPN
ncbi:MAG: VRR-NUC domain-containing protein [Turicibacter sp.]|nr:VRR-NUC domain-containing protein [Turicibacter sp.]